MANHSPPHMSHLQRRRGPQSGLIPLVLAPPPSALAAPSLFNRNSHPFLGADLHPWPKFPLLPLHRRCISPCGHLNWTLCPSPSIHLVLQP